MRGAVFAHAPRCWPRGCGPSYSFRAPKGRQPRVSGYAHVGPPRTEAGRARVQLPLVAVGVSRAHLDWYRPADPGCLAPGGEPCVSPLVGATTRTGLVTGPLSRILDPRPAAVSLGIAAGASPIEVAARSGHSSVWVVGHLVAICSPAQPKGSRPHSGPCGRGKLAPFAWPSRGDQARWAQDTTVVRGNWVRAGPLQWALADSNRRPQPCEGCALTN